MNPSRQPVGIFENFPYFRKLTRNGLVYQHYQVSPRTREFFEAFLMDNIQDSIQYGQKRGAEHETEGVMNSFIYKLIIPVQNVCRIFFPEYVIQLNEMREEYRQECSTTGKD